MPNTVLQHTSLMEILLKIVLLLAMALPMQVLYTTSVLKGMLSHALHFPPAWLDYMVMSSFALAAFLSLWVGQVVNQIGSRLGLMSLFMLIVLAFTLMITTRHFYGLIAAALLCGIAQALANPVTNLLIAECIAPAKRAGVIGLKQSGVQVSALFSGLALPSIAVKYGWQIALGMIIPLGLCLTISIMWLAPQKKPAPRKPLRLTPPNRLVFGLMSIQFCIGLVISAFVTFLPSFTVHQGLSTPLAGSLIAWFGAMGIVSRIFLTGFAAKMQDESYLLCVLCVIAAIAIAITMQATPNRHWVLWAGAIGMGLTVVATNAIVMSILLRDSAFGNIAVGSGLISSAFFTGFAIGAPLHAHFTHYASTAHLSMPIPLGGAFLIAVLILAACLAIALAHARRKHRLEFV